MKNVSGKRPARIFFIVAVFLFLAGCSPDGQTGFGALADGLKSQIDRNQDDVLSAVSDKSIQELLSLDSVRFGSFTEDGPSEMLAIFKVGDVPHAGGLDRTVAALYDADTCRLKMQMTFAADSVSIALLRDAKEINHILFIGSTTYQGISASSIGLYRAGKDSFIPETVAGEPFADNGAYALSGDALQVFAPGEDGRTPIYRNTLYWNAEKTVFERELP